MYITRMPVRLLAVAMTLTASSQALATLVTYDVDPARSSLTLSASWLGQSVLRQQGQGSLTASYTGTIDADLEANTIQFTSAALDVNSYADTNRERRREADGWPGVGADDYSGTFRSRLFRHVMGRLNVAFRDVSLDLSSKPLTLADNTFDAGGMLGDIDGLVDYSGGGWRKLVRRGRAAIATSGVANNPGVGTLSTIDGFEEIEIPVELTFATYLSSPVSADYRQVLLTLSGNIVATRELPVGSPEPATAVLLAVGGFSLLRRRSRR